MIERQAVPDVVVLCGGMGTRMAEATRSVPKPMLDVGGRPIMWHVMHAFARHGCTRFVLALGHLGHVIRAYFLRYNELTRPVEVQLGVGSVRFLEAERVIHDWQVALVDTGAVALTATRVRAALPYTTSPEVVVTYGDAISDIDVTALLAFHRSHAAAATMTVARPQGRFGEVRIENDVVIDFQEKPSASSIKVNAGYFVFDRDALDAYLPSDDVMLEEHVLPKMIADGQLMAYEHSSFWEPMDTAQEWERLVRTAREGALPGYAEELPDCPTHNYLRK